VGSGRGDIGIDERFAATEAGAETETETESETEAETETEIETETETEAETETESGHGRGHGHASAADSDPPDIAPPSARTHRAASERHASGPGSSRPRGGSEPGLISERDLRAIEKEHPDGLTSVQVVDFFTRRGIRFSEATFRKYVQQGLLPRSRRVGRKGKHQGSLGLYPASTVRRINVIKRLQAEDHTI